MRFLHMLKRIGLTFIFIFGLLFALWLAFLAKPESEWIGRAEASAPEARIEPKPVTVKTVSGYSTPRSAVTTPPSTNMKLSATSSVSNLIIPVSGIRPEQLYDSFGDSRSEGRAHHALDIPAQKGTPVLAATDGVIKRIFYSERGGKTLYQLGTDGKIVYYYAHLDAYANTIAEGSTVKRGDVIAYVGDTGNAGSGNYHLHFAMWTVEDPKRIWHGDNINPFPLLR